MTRTKPSQRRIQFALILTGMIVAMLGSTFAQQDSENKPGPVPFGKPTELAMKRAGGTNIDLRTLPRTKPIEREREELEPPDHTPITLPSLTPTPEPSAPAVPHAPAPPPNAVYEGLDRFNWGAGSPPDTNGDVGPTYYIQTVNTSIGIFRKSDGFQEAAFTFNTFMSQGNFGNLCDTNNFGDPVVLYDTFEDRWIITDFAFLTDVSGNVLAPAFQAFAVSKNGNPLTGGWNFYSIQISDNLNDYPKFGIWPDGLYMSSNLFSFGAGATSKGVRLWAFNKAQMYAGSATVKIVSFDVGGGDFTLIPSNARLQAGTPPAGRPNMFVSTWLFTNALTVYKFHVDWNSISLSTLTGPDTPIAATSWPNAAVANAGQPGTAVLLDVLQIRAMVQNQYTNFGGTESLWLPHTVRRANTSGLAAPRWYQVNVTGGTVAASIPQASTWDPDGANNVNRFMPSLAVDRAGNMAMGYSMSNGTTMFPSMAYAGRLAGDPVNTFSLTEQTFFTGTASQTGTTRWGDYSSMTLDPDGCTFWYTNEYANPADQTFNHRWLTKFGSFGPLPGCTPVGAGGTVSGTVTVNPGGAPISGATVNLGARSTTTDGLGAYSFLNIPAGTYPSMTASFPGYVTGTASNIVVTDGNTTTQNFSLATAPTSACLVDTTQADFQTGIATNVDLTTSPGDVTLSNAPTIDQQNTAGTTTGTGFGTPTWTGQTFIAGVTGQIVKADVQLFCSGCGATPPNLTLSVRSTSAGLPTGADLATATIPGSTFASGASVTYTATFGAPVTLNSGIQYGLILRPVSAPAGSGYFWIRSSPSTYANGSRVLSADSGGTWSTDTTRDYNFKTYMQTGYASPGNLVSSPKDANPAAGITPIWSTLSWNATVPANTSLQFQVAGSNNVGGPFNFVGPDGTAGTFFTTSPTSLGQFYGLRYVQYKAYLATTDSTQTPALNDVTVCYNDTDCSGAPTITPTPAQVCANSTGNTASGPAGETSYSWSITNGTITSSTTSQSVTYTAGASGSVGLMLDIVEPGGCHKSGSVNVPINPIPATPTITPAGSATICPTGSVTLTSSSASGNQWYLNGNPIGGATNQQYIATAAGDYTVIVTISGCSSAASAPTTVTVSDTQPPTVTCPAPIVKSTDPNVCTAVVTFADPTVTDNCPPCDSGGNTKPGTNPQGTQTCSVTCSPASGSTFPKGVTTVTCTALDASNNQAQCSFTVTVNDMQAPTVTCPAPIVHSTDPNVCNAVVTFADPSVTDNCPPCNSGGAGKPGQGPNLQIGCSVVCTPASGSTFQKGVTTVSCTATDASSNTAQCSFTVTINDTQPPTVTCPAPIIQNTGANVCTAVVTFADPTVSDNCPPCNVSAEKPGQKPSAGTGNCSVVCSPASGSTFQKGVTTVSCTATDASNNTAQCSFTVTINDTQTPTITCPGNVTHGTDPNACQAVVTYTNATATDNCTGVGTPVCSPSSGSTFPKGTTTVMCTVSDASSNPASCTFTVTVNDTQNPTVTCPANITSTTPGASDPCGVVTYTTPAGSDNCPLGPNPVTCTPASGMCFPVGMTTVTCTVTDTAGNQGSCTFKITVQNPCTITCPANITKNNDPNQCGAVVTFAPSTSGGGCGTVTCTPASGSFFPKGTTTVTCTTTAGPSCSFTVTVNDTQPPNITCPANVTLGTDPNVCQAVVTYPAPAVSDNCPGVGAPVCTPASGSTFQKGTTTVTCTVKDPSNNMSMCSFTVTVNDTQPPVFPNGCPPGITKSAQANCPFTNNLLVTYTTPIATDNCGPAPTVTCTPPSGSVFPAGTTTVTCTATDSSGNTATCSFPINVFSLCLKDDSTDINTVFVNALTGDYLFCQNGVPLASGRGTLVVHGCNFQVDHIKGDRKVHIQGDTAANSGQGSGTAYIQKLGGGFVVQITDRKMIDDTCTCAPGLPPPVPPGK